MIYDDKTVMIKPMQITNTKLVQNKRLVIAKRGWLNNDGIKTIIP